MRQYWLSLAAGGVSIVRMAVPRIPPPNRYFPPSLFANHPTESGQNCLDTAETCFVNGCYPLIKFFSLYMEQGICWNLMYCAPPPTPAHRVLDPLLILCPSGYC